MTQKLFHLSRTSKNASNIAIRVKMLIFEGLCNFFIRPFLDIEQAVSRISAAVLWAV